MQIKISIHGSSIDQVLTSILTKKRPCIGQYVVCVLTNTLANTRLTHGLICGLCLLDSSVSQYVGAEAAKCSLELKVMTFVLVF